MKYSKFRVYYITETRKLFENTDGEKPKGETKNKPEAIMKRLFKGIAITALILAGIAATAINEISNLIINQEIISNLINN